MKKSIHIIIIAFFLTIYAYFITKKSCFNLHMKISYFKGFDQFSYISDKQIWRNIIKDNLSRKEIATIMNKLYPYEEMNQKVFFYDPNKAVEKFGGKGIYGIEEVQKKIYENQFVKNCSERNFLVMLDWDGGIGALIHGIGTFLAKAMNLNRTLIYYPNYRYMNLHMSKEKCKDKLGFDCFIHPITSCKFTAKEIDSNKKRFLRLGFFKGFSRTIPNSIIPIIEKSGTPKELYFYYWRLQATYFVLRLNEETEKLVNEIRNKALVNPKDHYDVMIHVRHGDKHKEMKLINTKDYVYPLEIISKLLQKKLSVFVSSDDQEAIDYLINLDKKKYEFSYFNFKHHSNGYSDKKRGFDNSLQTFADLFESAKANYLIGTLISNVDRVILELRLLYGGDMNLPFFDVSETICITFSQCKALGMVFNLIW